jgi:peptide/nickel transport system ATP-binding protein
MMNTSTNPRTVLDLAGLSVTLSTGEPVVEQLSLQLGEGEILGIVGESGSGKTTTALSLLGYSTRGAEITGGQLRFKGDELVMDESMRANRGTDISYVPQDPSRSLNPALRISGAIRDVLDAHCDPSRLNGEAVTTALGRVGLVDIQSIGERYPHQLSGGQQQRVAIAMALSCDPAVVVLDEPTTGLDVVTQAKILEELLRLRDERGISMVYVTHDLAVVAQIADRIAVMYAGRIVEQGTAASVLRDPRHPYTRGLLASIPDHIRPRRLEAMPGISVGVGGRPEGCAFAPRCPHSSEACTTELPALVSAGPRHEVRCIHLDETDPAVTRPVRASSPHVEDERAVVLSVEQLAVGHRVGRTQKLAASDISFSIARGECVALVGESGSGKTTIARAISGLHPLSGGRMTLHGQTLPDAAGRRSREQRRQIQLVFQNPASALNPHHTVRDSVARPARLLRNMDSALVRGEVDRLLECVRLQARLADRYPHELSGGERQRVAIARALAAEPDVIVCDEVTSALDVSVQAAVLELLAQLRSDLGLGLLFITHDLGVVANSADRVLVLDAGRICDEGPTAAVLTTPKDPYTERLLAAAPSISVAIEGWATRPAVGATSSMPTGGRAT